MKYAIGCKYSGIRKFKGFIRLDDEGVVKFLDPSKATLFSSKKEAEAWLKKHISEPEDFFLVSEKELKDRAKEFEEFLKGGGLLGEVTLIDPTMNVMFDPEKHTVFDLMDWMYRYVAEGMEDKIAFDVYCSWHDARYGNLEGSAFQNFEVFLDDKTMEVCQIVPVFRVTTDFPFKQLEKEATYLLDKYPFFKNQEDGLLIYLNVDIGDTYDYKKFVIEWLDEEKWHAYNTKEKVYHKGTLEECYNRITDWVKNRRL